MPSFFENRKGSVISTTFDKYVYVTVRHLPKFFDYADEIIYSQTERVKRIDDIKHPMVRNAMKMLDMHQLHISYDADLPAKTGLGTSSTFAVGLLNAFYSLKGKFASKRKLAENAIYLERTLCQEAGGWQDQIAASFGGLNRIDFYGNDFEINPIVISPKRKTQLNSRLMLFFTGFTRFSAAIQQAVIKSKGGNNNLERMMELVDRAESVLQDKNYDLDEFGRLLGIGWELKRGTSSVVSTDSIDAFYKKGIEAGAIGGKLLGAGGGGFLLFYVPEDRQDAVREALSDLMEVPFEFEDSGTKAIYYSPEPFDVNGNVDD